MRDENDIVRERQLAVRRELDRRGISLKAVSFDAGLPYSTIVSYFPADGTPHIISGGALFKLTRAIPADVLSLLLPDGFLIVRAPVEIDHDHISEAMREYLAAKDHAHHPESEAGREIGPGEDETLRGKLSVVKVAA